jgi:hypothetical protein
VIQLILRLCFLIALCPGSLAMATQPAVVSFTVTNPRATVAEEIVRVSLPVPQGMVAKPPQCVFAGTRRLPAQATVITRHPDNSIRRVMLSFRPKITPGATVAYLYRASAPAPAAPSLAAVTGAGATINTRHWRLQWQESRLAFSTPEGRSVATLEAFGPSLQNPRPATLAVLDNGRYFVWLRWRQDGEDYSREVDVQADSEGRLQLTQRVLRHLTGNGWTPDFGFTLTAPGATPVRLPPQPVRFLALPVNDPLGKHPELVAALQLTDGTTLSAANPLALRQHRGTLENSASPAGLSVRFSRLEPVAQERQNLQLQEGMWREIVVRLQPGLPEQLAQAIDQPLVAHANWRAYDAVYRTGPPLQVKSPVLQRLVEKYIAALVSLSMSGDDWGSLGGLERYNHCGYIWEDVFRTGDPRLRRVALDYTENYHNFSVNWGPNPDHYGGGRYPPDTRTQPWPGSFRTRHNDAVTFCTKGYHGFWLAYEETGDPRYRHAAEAQAGWAAKHVTAGLNYTRCIGQVTDFVKLCEYTGNAAYLEQANRLWGNLQAVQTPDLLFTESGRPATGNDLYVPDDRFGSEHPYVKSYITQYATNALPQLLAHQPGDTRLRATIIAGSDWMAQVQTPGGGWSYPGPTTAGFWWSTEYCHGLMEGYKVSPKPQYLDAIQRDLRALIALSEIYDAIPSGVSPWERLAGLSNDELGRRYHRGTDRDRSKDFTDGQITFGFSPDSTVYFQVLLRDYLRHRPEASLFTFDPVLDQILRQPAALEAGLGQTGDPSLRISVQTSATPEGLRVHLAASAAYKLAGTALDYRWTLPDGAVLPGREITHLFTRGGTFEIVLQARDAGAEYTRRLSLTTPAGPWDIGLQQWPPGLRVQAEAFTAQGGAELVAKIRTSEEKLGSDGGSISHTDALGLWQQWAVDVPRAGQYLLLVRYATPHAALRLLSLGGQEVGRLSLAPTGGYGSAITDNWRVELLRDTAGKPLALQLSAGQTTLRVTNADGKGCNLDYLELLPAP